MYAGGPTTVLVQTVISPSPVALGPDSAVANRSEAKPKKKQEPCIATKLSLFGDLSPWGLGRGSLSRRVLVGREHLAAGELGGDDSCGNNCGNNQNSLHVEASGLDGEVGDVGGLGHGVPFGRWGLSLWPM